MTITLGGGFTGKPQGTLYGQTATTSGASDVYGAWVQVVAAVAVPVQIAGIWITTTSAGAPAQWAIDIGTGGAGSEVVVATVNGYANAINVPQYVPFPKPVKIAAGMRIAARSKTGAAGINVVAALDVWA